MWEFIIYNQDESEQWEIPYTKISFTEELNKGADGNMSIPYVGFKQYADALNTTPDDIFKGGFRSWKLIRDGDVFRIGVLTHRSINGGAKGASAINLHFTDYLGFLSSRDTQEEKIYSSEDSADIAWGEINTAQTQTNGDMGITRGTHPTTVDRDRTLRYENILHLLVGMSNAKQSSGYDMDIDTTKKFNIYWPEKGSVKENVIFSEFNMDSWTLNMPLTAKLANKVNVLGKGFGDDMATASVEDTTYQTTWGLLETTLSEKDVGTVSELENRGNKLLDDLKNPENTINIATKDLDPEVTDYNLGDTVTVEINELDYSKQLRIIKRTFTITPNGDAIINLSFEQP